MAVNAYVVLGDTNTKKSSTVRALTGVCKAQEYRVTTSREVLSVYVQISALQEAKISPDEFIAQMQKQKTKNVLLTLRVKRARNLPSGTEYIKQFRNKGGWRIKDVVVLGKDQANLPSSLPQSCYCIENSRDITSNHIANQLRKRWKWF